MKSPRDPWKRSLNVTPAFLMGIGLEATLQSSWVINDPCKIWLRRLGKSRAGPARGRAPLAGGPGQSPSLLCISGRPWRPRPQPRLGGRGGGEEPGWRGLVVKQLLSCLPQHARASQSSEIRRERLVHFPLTSFCPLPIGVCKSELQSYWFAGCMLRQPM